MRGPYAAVLGACRTLTGSGFESASAKVALREATERRLKRPNSTISSSVSPSARKRWSSSPPEARNGMIATEDGRFLVSLEDLVGAD
jgi:hypothetical protein